MSTVFKKDHHVYRFNHIYIFFSGLSIKLKNKIKDSAWLQLVAMSSYISHAVYSLLEFIFSVNCSQAQGVNANLFLVNSIVISKTRVA